MTERLRVLVVGSESQKSRELAAVLLDYGMAPVSAASVLGAMTRLATEDVVVVFCAAELEDGSYGELVRELKLANWKVPVVVVFRLGDWKEYLEAIRLGAFDCIAPPYRHSEIARIIGTVLREQERREVVVGTSPL
jgi:two-component system, NtrC family, response regulator PilR